MNNKKRENQIGMTNTVNIVYLFLVLVAGPFVIHDSYFDITVTRYRFFLYASVLFIIMRVLSWIVESALTKKQNVIDANHKWYKRNEFWAMAFIVANVFAWIVAEEKNEAMLGTDARYMGLLTYVLLLVVYIFLSKNVSLKEVFAQIFLLVVCAVDILGFIQFFGIDIFGLKAKISAKDYYLYYSSFGNINVLSSFVVMAIGVGLVAVLYAKDIKKMILPAVSLGLSAGMLSISASDSAFLGIGAIAILTIYIAYREKRVDRAFLGFVFFALGRLIVTGVIVLGVTEYKPRRGIMAKLDSIPASVGLLVIAIILWLLARRIAWTRKKIIQLYVILLLICTGALLAGNYIFELGIFKFDYKWGNNRGYIWSKSVEAYADAPLTNKLFGYGQGSINQVVSQPNYDEMLRVTKKIYDNTHNEPLQYLLTTGIMGLVSYLGLCVSTFVKCIKKQKIKPANAMCLVAWVGYFAQALVNINQPLTTPIFFILMALSVGLI